MITLQTPRDTCIWLHTGTKTFRLSSKKLLGHWGGNLQNKPDEIRKIYIPDDGKCFVSCDQAGAEALIVAYLAKPGKFRALFDNSIKPHTYVASGIFSEYWREVGFNDIYEMLKMEIKALAEYANFQKLSKLIKQHDKENEKPYYYMGKKTCHASNYKMAEYTFAEDILKESNGKIRLSIPEAARFLKTYHTMFPEIREWQISTEQTLMRAKLLRNLQGYPRQFTGVITDETVRDAIAFVPQSTVATITNIAACNLYDTIPKDWDILLNGHDSLLLQCPVSNLKDCAKLLKESLEQELVSPRGEHFRMKTELKTGMNYGNYNEHNNPDGMKDLKI